VGNEKITERGSSAQIMPRNVGRIEGGEKNKKGPCRKKRGYYVTRNRRDLKKRTVWEYRDCPRQWANGKAEGGETLWGREGGISTMVQGRLKWGGRWQDTLGWK